MIMRKIVGIIDKNQASGGKWLISEAIAYNVRVYIYCSSDEVNEVLKADLDQILEYQDGSWEDIQLRRNLEETHMKMR